MFQAIFQFSVNSQEERRKALKINNCVEDKKKIHLNITLHLHRLAYQIPSAINKHHLKTFNSYKFNQKIQTVQIFHSKKK